MPRSANKITVEVAVEQTTLPVDRRRISRAVGCVLRGEKVASAAISVAIVDDATIHRLNRQYLHHDYPTDVLSFELERDGDHLEGEVIVSADTAMRAAHDYGWAAEAELLLYVVHGTLHLAGHQDDTTSGASVMRERERHYLDQLGIALPADSQRTPRQKREPSNKRDGRNDGQRPRHRK